MRVTPNPSTPDDTRLPPTQSLAIFFSRRLPPPYLPTDDFSALYRRRTPAAYTLATIENGGQAGPSRLSVTLYRNAAASAPHPLSAGSLRPSYFGLNVCVYGIYITPPPHPPPETDKNIITSKPRNPTPPPPPQNKPVRARARVRGDVYRIIMCKRV